jgi:quinol monooxygenase YgiN
MPRIAALNIGPPPPVCQAASARNNASIAAEPFARDSRAWLTMLRGVADALVALRCSAAYSAPSTAAGTQQRHNSGMQEMQQDMMQEMQQEDMQQSFANELSNGGGLLVVAQWEAKAAEAERVADILRRFLPRAQAEPGVKLFLIARSTTNAAQFMFYELFADEAAFAAHQASEHFKTFIAGEALPLLARRERSQYRLL